ncbi:Tox-REase-5 domain-containing protein [Asaia platycodi]|uniref:Tox-REase-5 domain-containing protein n=1 Tax=Asaia platycodi TaxID=610243 RepID=UPI00046F647F|nr:Tox-REase-5 domain-containing protein [Asaia platycodi]
MSAGQENYQIKTAGAPKDIAYVVAGADGKEVKFDGYDPNTGALLDAKRWTSWPLPGKDFNEKSVMDQINRQLPAANGRVVEWFVP